MPLIIRTERDVINDMIALFIRQAPSMESRRRMQTYINELNELWKKRDDGQGPAPDETSSDRPA